MPKPKIIIFCSDDKRFPAIEYVEALLEEFQIVAWIDKKPHHKFSHFCLNHKIVYFPEYQIDLLLNLIKSEDINFGIVLSFNKIFPEQQLSALSKGLLNCHPSDLPHFRGGSPVESSIIAGLKELVISAMLLENAMDAGPVVAKIRLNSKEHDLINARDCYQAIAKQATWFSQTAKQYYQDTDFPLSIQDPTQVSYCQKLPLKKLNFLTLEADNDQHLINLINAYCVSPKVYLLKSDLNDNTKSFDLIKLAPNPINLSEVPQLGQLYFYQKKVLLGLKNTFAEVLRIQPESRNELSPREFINGYPDFISRELTQ